MWVRTEAGTLLNIDMGGMSIFVDHNNALKAGLNNDEEFFLARFDTRPQAEAALDRLEKWIAEDGWAEVGAESTKPWSSVFSLRPERGRSDPAIPRATQAVGLGGK